MKLQVPGFWGGGGREQKNQRIIADWRWYLDIWEIWEYGMIMRFGRFVW